MNKFSYFSYKILSPDDKIKHLDEIKTVDGKWSAITNDCWIGLGVKISQVNMGILPMGTYFKDRLPTIRRKIKKINIG